MLLFKTSPCNPVVFFAVGAEEGGVVFDGLAPGAGGVGGVCKCLGDFALFEVLDVFPAEGDAGFVAVWRLDGVFDFVVEVGLAGFSGEADAG